MKFRCIPRTPQPVLSIPQTVYCIIFCAAVDFSLPGFGRRILHRMVTHGSRMLVTPGRQETILRQGQRGLQIGGGKLTSLPPSPECLHVICLTGSAHEEESQGGELFSTSYSSLQNPLLKIMISAVPQPSSCYINICMINGKERVQRGAGYTMGTRVLSVF